MIPHIFRRRRHIEEGTRGSLLTTTLGGAAPPADPPFRQRQWDNPVLGRRSIALLLWFNCAIIALAAQAPFPGKAEASQRARLVQQPQAATNLLTTTLAVAPAPFSQKDWPNPKRKSAQIAGTDNVAIQDDNPAPPVRPVAVENPRVKRGLNVGFTQASLREVVVVAAPFAQYDWANPLIKRARDAGFVQQKTLDPPFATPQWTNPRAKPAPQVGFEVRSIMEQPGTPFVPVAFQNPELRTGAKLPYLLWTNAPLVPDVPPAAGTPFAQYEWPLAVRAKSAQQPDQKQSLALPSAPVADPFKPVAFPNPTLGKKLPIVHEVQNVLARGIPEPAVEYVFREALVSPPVRTRRAQQPDLRGSRAILDVPVAAPFRQADWALPTRARAVQQPDQRQSLALASAPVATPFTQSEWPIPVRQRSIQQPEYRAGLSLLTAPVITPQVQSSFAMPVVAKAWRQNDGWISQTQINLGVPDAVVPPVEEPPQGTGPEKRFREDWEDEREKAAKARYANSEKRPETQGTPLPPPAQVVVEKTPTAPERQALTPPSVSGQPSDGLDSAQQSAENARKKALLAEIAGEVQVTAALIEEAIAENKLREERIAQAQAEEDAAVAAAIIAMLLDDE